MKRRSANDSLYLNPLGRDRKLKVRDYQAIGVTELNKVQAK